MQKDRALERVAASRSGVVTREQAVACGFSKSALSRRVRSGALDLVFPGVYVVAATTRSFDQLLMAASAWAGPEAAISHRSAAYIHRLLVTTPSKADLILDRRCKSPGPEIVLHTARLEPRDVRRWRGIAVTSPARTLFDLSAVVKPDQLESAFEVAFREGLISPRAMVKDLPRFRGQRGVRVLEALLKTETPSESELELRFLRLIRKWRLPLPQRQVPIHLEGQTVRLDFAYTDRRLGIECDGYRYHATPWSWERDRTKLNLLVRAGWTVLRFTWDDIVNRQEYVVTAMRDALEGRFVPSNA